MSDSGEREMLLGYLQRQRDLVAWKLADLSDADAQNVATPSGMTIHGVVNHLIDVERSWVRRWFAGEPGVQVEGIDANHVVEPSVAPEGVTLTELLGRYAEESRRCDVVIAAHRLDDAAADAPNTLRWILHHLVEETARHLGHLDLLCELADGRTGED